MTSINPDKIPQHIEKLNAPAPDPDDVPNEERIRATLQLVLVWVTTAIVVIFLLLIFAVVFSCLLGVAIEACAKFYTCGQQFVERISP
jgi:hypothetical protein